MSHFIYRGKAIENVGLLGLGKSNISVMEYISKSFPNVSFTVRAEQPAELSGFNIARSLFGKAALSDISEDMLFLSPSARRDKAEISEASSRGVLISSDAELFFEKNESDVYGITGSDGKSTTTALAAMMLSNEDCETIPIGNIGVPFSSRLGIDGRFSYAAELSSFQLMYMKPKTRRCVITNITENHLNWHTSFDEYIGAKRNILENSSERIINYDSDITRELGRDFPLFAVFSARLGEAELRKQIKAELYVTRSENFIMASGEPIIDIRDIKVCGEHNILNFMSAAALSFGICDVKRYTEIAKGFSGLAHRCESLGVYRGVRYYDSSIDSSPIRTSATLAAVKEKVIIILGGRSKGLDFKALIPSLNKKAKHIVLTGECSDEIERLLIDADISNYTVKKPFASAVKYAAYIASAGDAVLLSPAATSYDEFSSFEERGNEFKRIIKDI